MANMFKDGSTKFPMRAVNGGLKYMEENAESFAKNAF